MSAVDRKPQVTGSFPFYFIRTYPSPGRLKVMMVLLGIFFLSIVGAGIGTYLNAPKTDRTQSAPTITATVQKVSVEAQHSRSAQTGYRTYFTFSTPRGPAKLEFDVKVDASEGDQVALKQDPKDPSYVELPGYPQNSKKGGLGSLLMAPAVVVIGVWFRRRELHLIAGGEPIHRDAWIAGLLSVAIIGFASTLLTSGIPPYPEGFTLPAPSSAATPAPSATPSPVATP